MTPKHETGFGVGLKSLDFSFLRLLLSQICHVKIQVGKPIKMLKPIKMMQPVDLFNFFVKKL